MRTTSSSREPNAARSPSGLLVALIVAAAACRAEADPVPPFGVPAPAAAPPAPAGGTRDQARSPCASIADPWVLDLCTRATRRGLYELAARSRGPAASCSGSTTAEFEGRKFGNLRCEWSTGERFSVSTSPPESSSFELENPAGLIEPEAVRSGLEEYVNAIGLRIDWSAPETSETVQGSLVEFSDPRVNGFVRLRYNRAHELVGVWVSMAL